MQSTRLCSVDGCERDIRKGGFGYCRPHYRRFKRWGDPLGSAPVPEWATCSVSGCKTKSRSRGGELCEMHYHRAYRGGEVGTAEHRKRAFKNPHCQIEGCVNPDSESGLCSMHATRIRRHGDPDVVVAPEDRDYPLGDSHHNWVGDRAGYGTVHARVRRQKGRAQDYPCVDCGESAAHWSYDHNDLDEKHEYVEHVSQWLPYSLNVDCYSARCVSCHKMFDLSFLAVQYF